MLFRSWTRGSQRTTTPEHPFRHSLATLRVGDTIATEPRTITLDDIDHFADFTGDTFYAHTDPEAAAQNPLFGGIVAHGYLIVSMAAGLFVDPAPGPVLANYGLNHLRFTKPVGIGDTIQARLTCKRKIDRNKVDERGVGQGVVAWDVEVTNQDGELVASYDILTLVAKKV